MARSKITFMTLVGFGLAGIASAQVHESKPYPPFEWASTPPADCPFEPSDTLTGIRFTGRHQEYTNADSWFPQWAEDGNLYSSFTDGTVDGLRCLGHHRDKAQTGHAKIVGNDPLKLKIIPLGTYTLPARPYDSRYPSGSLLHDGYWYYGSHPEGPDGRMIRDNGAERNWAWLGPFMGFRISKDYGKTWTPSPHTFKKPMFGEAPLDEKGRPARAPIRIGEPWFVDFGKNMEHSPDGKAYLVAHGAADRDPRPGAVNCSWSSGDQAFLLRVTPGPRTINDPDQYEFFAGHDDAGKAVWVRDLSRIKPLIDWKTRVGPTTMTYNPVLKKYLFCITDGSEGAAPYDTYILESSSITGPWKLVVYMKHFGEQGYFVNIPSKFIQADGRTMWLCYAANFSGAELKDTAPLKSNPPGSRYAMNLQEIKLKGRK